MSVKDRVWFPIMYMFLATGFFSAILFLFSTVTQERVKNNERIAFERAVLKVLPRQTAPASPGAIHALYEEVIQDSLADSYGALRYIRDDSIVAYILPVQGPGFWAPIRGVIGIDKDQTKITGVFFYEQNETPGLGGEIVKAAFLNQFAGKKIAREGAALVFRPIGSELDESSVHTVTGATQTSTRVGEILNTRLSTWRERTRQE